MARYVILEFADNEEADDFVNAIQEGQVFMGKPHPDLKGQYNVVRPKEPLAVVGLLCVRPLLVTALPKLREGAGTLVAPSTALWSRLLR